MGEELGRLLERMSKMPNTNLVIGIFDRDKHIQAPDEGKAYKALGNKVFRLNIPSLTNEERAYSDKICIEHYYTNSEIEMNTDFGHLYMGKDFNEYGQSSDRNWCFQNYAKNQSLTPISIIDGTNIHMQKLCGEAQIITKDDFADYVINHPTEFNFANFRKIFEVIRAIDAEDNPAQFSEGE